ncbi:MAG: UDP-glucose/GDP-mannose dehydrogenase family protein [Methanomassiliicoccales archaeon]|nr:UDP-glucose/GDP-mannose dehydrogenase family protein [Methanomassiliicoccales archaeon]
MRTLSVIGAGYVGLSLGVGFSDFGYRVILVDVDVNKVKMINSGISPMQEKGIDEALREVLDKGRLEATTSIDYAIENSDATFVCVQTPSNKNGSINLKFVLGAAREIGKNLMKKDEHLVVIKSTVVPGTTENKIIPIIERRSGKRAGKDFGICMSPEFLSEGTALCNFFKPDRIVIGEFDKRSGDSLESIYSVFDQNIPRIRVDLKTAEMIKYASNAFIGTKISFANEIGNMCKVLGIDGRKVMEAVALDHRFSKYFMKPGMSFGGPCLEKDLTAIICLMNRRGYNPKLLKSVVELNRMQTKKLIGLVKNKIKDKKVRRVGILGLSFKRGTSDVRDGCAIRIIPELINENVDIIAYDPISEENMRAIFPQVDYRDGPQDVINDSEVVIILTDYEEFIDLDYAGKIVIDGRGIIPSRACGEYEGMCW